MTKISPKYTANTGYQTATFMDCIYGSVIQQRLAVRPIHSGKLYALSPMLSTLSGLSPLRRFRDPFPSGDRGLETGDYQNPRNEQLPRSRHAQNRLTKNEQPGAPNVRNEQDSPTPTPKWLTVTDSGARGHAQPDSRLAQSE